MIHTEGAAYHSALSQKLKTMNMMNLPDQFSNLSQEQKDKLAEIGFCYIKSLLKEIESDTIMQDLSLAKQTQKIDQYIKQVSQL